MTCGCTPDPCVNVRVRDLNQTNPCLGPQGYQGQIGPQGHQGGTGGAGPQGPQAATGVTKLPTSTSDNTVVAQSNSVTPIVLKGANTQNADLMEIKDSNDNNLDVFDKNGYGFPYVLVFDFAETGDAAVATDVAKLRVAVRAGKIVKAFINAKQGPQGSSNNLICDINKNNTSIWSTNQGNRVQIALGNTSGTSTTFDTINFSEGDVFTIDVDQVGDVVAGSKVAVHLLTMVKNQ